MSIFFAFFQGRLKFIQCRRYARNFNRAVFLTILRRYILHYTSYIKRNEEVFCMRSVNSLKTAKIAYIGISVLFCVLGILLIIFPGTSEKVIGILCGILMILFGVVKILGYFSKDLYRLAFQYDLAFGILTIILGIMLFKNPFNLMNFICVILGIAVLSDGLFKMQMSLDAKRFGIREWWLIFAFAVIAAAFGIVLIIKPAVSASFLTVLLGICLLLEGILNISTAITAVKIIRYQQPDIID